MRGEIMTDNQNVLENQKAEEKKVIHRAVEPTTPRCNPNGFIATA